MSVCVFLFVVPYVFWWSAASRGPSGGVNLGPLSIVSDTSSRMGDVKAKSQHP